MPAKQHSRRLSVWDVPEAIDAGQPFSIRAGLRCADGCRAEVWAVEVRDHSSQTVAAAVLGQDPWPGTVALFHTEIALLSPEATGLYSWTITASAADGPHGGEVQAGFSVRVVPAAECRLTVAAFDRHSQQPLPGLRVVAHPYRTQTDERGIAELRVPRGHHRVFVSGQGMLPFRSDCEVAQDLHIRAELVPDREPIEAELWP